MERKQRTLHTLDVTLCFTDAVLWAEEKESYAKDSDDNNRLYPTIRHGCGRLVGKAIGLLVGVVGSTLCTDAGRSVVTGDVFLEGEVAPERWALSDTSHMAASMFFFR